MPVFFQKDINDSTKLAIWKIEEEELFFLAQVPLQREITHPHKRLQHLAGRYLLKYLFPHFPVELIRIADTRKPFLENEAYHFSISHCSDYAAVIVSKTKRVGIDIEMISQKVARIKHKFISDEEERRVNSQWSMVDGQSTCQPINLSTLIWSCKEAVFKWHGWGGVDFREHIKIQNINAANEENRFRSLVLFKKNEDLFLDLHSGFFNDLCLSYVIT